MDEKQKEPIKNTSLFERLKETILKKNIEPEPVKEQPEIPSTSGLSASSPDDAPETQNRGIVSVPTNSLLFSLWYEWNMAVNGEAEEAPEGNSPLMPELELILEKSDAVTLPLTTEELESEKQRAQMQLLIRAKTHHQLTRPNEEGVTPTVDAEVTIYVAHRRMAAWAFVFPPSGEGRPLQRAQLDAALTAYSVSAGIFHESLDYIIDKQPYFKLIPIASGTPMIPGTNGWVEEKYPRSLEKTFGTTDRGNVDYRIQNYVQIIHTGDVICEAIPPTLGEDGIDVLGTVIPAKNGTPAKLTAGQNTSLDEENTKITAAMDGHLVYESGKFQVKPVFFVNGDVDFNVGNIDFLGDVHVSGNILEDFIVHASGTITVEGLVEGALLEAGRDVIIANGILGDDKSVIKAGGSVQAEYIENSIIYAGENVRASTIISSYIYSDNEIIVRSGRGTIIGGKLVAANLIDAGIIGCRAERPTTLIIGELPYIQQQKEEIALILEKIQKETKEIERTIQFFANTANGDPEKLQNAANYRLHRSTLAMQAAHLQKQLEEFAERKTDVANCKIVANSIFPVTQIYIQDYSYTITEETKHRTIRMGPESILLL